jgi:hypothetical protein
MPSRPNIGTWARMVLLLGGVLLIMTALRSGGPGEMALAVDGQGLSFELRTAFINLAFDIGQSCPKTDTCRKLMG